MLYPHSARPAHAPPALPHVPAPSPPTGESNPAAASHAGTPDTGRVGSHDGFEQSRVRAIARERKSQGPEGGSRGGSGGVSGAAAAGVRETAATARPKAAAVRAAAATEAEEADTGQQAGGEQRAQGCEVGP